MTDCAVSVLKWLYGFFQGIVNVWFRSVLGCFKHLKAVAQGVSGMLSHWFCKVSVLSLQELPWDIQGKVSWEQTIWKSFHIFESFCQKGALFPLMGYIWGWFTQICLPALLWEVPSLVLCCSILWKGGLTSGYPPCFQVKRFSSFLSLSCVSNVWARGGYLRCDREPRDKARHNVSSSCVTWARKQRSVAWLCVRRVAMLMCQNTSGSKGWKNTSSKCYQKHAELSCCCVSYCCNPPEVTRPRTLQWAAACRAVAIDVPSLRGYQRHPTDSSKDSLVIPCSGSLTAASFW